MLYPICPTCGHLLADIELEFTDKYNKINNNNDIETKKDSDIKKLFIDLKINKYCCRMRLISYVDLIKIII
jgi:DNA-directed RNA polymerase subunit N (RpoN/RPB10)